MFWEQRHNRTKYNLKKRFKTHRQEKLLLFLAENEWINLKSVNGIWGLNALLLDRSIGVLF